MREDRVGVWTRQGHTWGAVRALVRESEWEVNDITIGVDYWVARDRVGRSLVVAAEIRVYICLNAVELMGGGVSLVGLGEPIVA